MENSLVFTFASLTRDREIREKIKKGGREKEEENFDAKVFFFLRHSQIRSSSKEVNESKGD